MKSQDGTFQKRGTIPRFQENIVESSQKHGSKQSQLTQMYFSE